MPNPICIQLPNTGLELPQALRVMTGIPMAVEGEGGTSLAALRERLAALTPVADCIAGSDTTPALYWLAAQAAFPQARVIVHCAVADDEAGWIDLLSGERLSLVLPDSGSALQDAAARMRQKNG